MEDDTELEFEGKAFTDADLKAVPALDRVEMLDLFDTSVTDKGIVELARAESLEEIAISSDKLSSAALQVLARLPSLRSLQIHRGPRIGDEGLRSLSKCVNLRELYLRGTSITDAGLSHIGSLPHLWSLVLDDTGISDTGCAAITKLPKLSLLSLNRTRVTGIRLAGLRDNEYFNLYLEETRVTDEAVMTLAGRLTKLKLISLNETQTGDPAAKALSKLKRLDDVRLSGTRLSDDGLAAFTGHPSLEVIYVEGCNVSAKAIKALKKASSRELTVYGP